MHAFEAKNGTCRVLLEFEARLPEPSQLFASPGDETAFPGCIRMLDGVGAFKPETLPEPAKGSGVAWLSAAKHMTSFVVQSDTYTAHLTSRVGCHFARGV